MNPEEQKKIQEDEGDDASGEGEVMGDPRKGRDADFWYAVGAHPLYSGAAQIKRQVIENQIKFNEVLREQCMRLGQVKNVERITREIEKLREEIGVMEVMERLGVEG
jgi:hypothetical protein